jgi:hypothetical protein
MEEPVSDKPNPGSSEAIKQGCECPVMDNWRGSDELGRVRGFVVREGCPLHWADWVAEHEATKETS